MSLTRSIALLLGLTWASLALAAPPAPPKPVAPTGGGEMLQDAPPSGPPRKFQPATKEEADQAIAAYKAFVSDVQEKLHVKFATMETAHFLIFTDWDKREHDFLKKNVEEAYTVVSRQFEISPSTNVFIGKLPVLMFTTQKDFTRYSKEIESFDVPANVAGYYTGNTRGFGRMVMWKPDVKKANGNVHLAEVIWAYTLTHEFTHAFVARYRTNGLVPRWVNEGLAEVVASRQFPTVGVHDAARDQAKKRKSIQDMFEENRGLLRAEEYPVAQTLVETMLAENPKTFLRFFNDVKDGTKPEDALKKEYKTDNHGLEAAWRKYVATAKDAR
jgi:hypothetical protein